MPPGRPHYPPSPICASGGTPHGGAPRGGAPRQGTPLGVPGSFVSSLQTASGRLLPAARQRHRGQRQRQQGEHPGAPLARHRRPAPLSPRRRGAPGIRPPLARAAGAAPGHTGRPTSGGKTGRGATLETWPGTEALRTQESRTGGNKGAQPRGLATPEKDGVVEADPGHASGVPQVPGTPRAMHAPGGVRASPAPAPTPTLRR